MMPDLKQYTVVQIGGEGQGGPYQWCEIDGATVTPCEGCTESCDHQLRDEAYAHHRAYVLTNLQEVDRLQCEVWHCPNMTDKALTEPDNITHHFLCDEHRSRDMYAATFYPPDQHRSEWRL